MTTKKQLSVKEATKIIARAIKINPKPIVKILGQNCRLAKIHWCPGKTDEEINVVEFEYEYIKLPLKFIISSDIIDQLKYIVDNTPNDLPLLSQYMTRPLVNRPWFNFLGNQARIIGFYPVSCEDNDCRIVLNFKFTDLELTTTLSGLNRNTDIMQQIDYLINTCTYEINKDDNNVPSEEKELQ